MEGPCLERIIKDLKNSCPGYLNYIENIPELLEEADEDGTGSLTDLIFSPSI